MKDATFDGADVGRSETADAKGFAYLKRDLVRLLGALVHEDRAMQDRVRAAEGIPVVLSLCVVDERNPCTFLSFVLCFANSGFDIPRALFSCPRGVRYLHFSPPHATSVSIPTRGNNIH